MSIDEFLAEMDADDFTRPKGRWQTFDNFDPPFRRGDLRAMKRAGVIELDEDGKRFRLLVPAPPARRRSGRPATRISAQRCAMRTCPTPT